MKIDLKMNIIIILQLYNLQSCNNVLLFSPVILFVIYGHTPTKYFALVL